MKGIKAITDKLEKLKDFQNNAAKYAIDAFIAVDYVVLDMNFSEQLADQGVNRNNVPIMDYQPYSPATEIYKQAKGQPFDRVTLNDEGDFHSGGQVERVDDLTAEIKSTDEKSTWLQDKYGVEVLGLTPDNLEETRQSYVKPFLIEKLQEV